MEDRLVDALRAQVEELQALGAMYPEDGAMHFEPAERAALALAESLVESVAGGKASDAAAQGLSQLSGMLVLQGLRVGGQPVSLRFTLPAAYPQAALPRLQVVCACSRAHHDELTAAMQQLCEAPAEGGCLIMAADALQQRASEMLKQGQLQAEAPADDEAEQRHSLQCGPITLTRCVIWFHHIKSTTKRKHIVQWAGELQLGGYSKPGFPGVIVCEGLAGDVAEYLERLRALKWQAMAVRGQEDEAVERPSAAAAARRLGAPGNGGAAFRELPETGMSALAAACRAAGLEELFLVALKIVRS